MEHNIKLLIMDVDGTMTDGKIYIGNNGEVMKAFSSKDGYGLNVLLRKAGIKTAIITGRTSEIVANRAKEVGVSELYQGVTDKPSAMADMLCKLNLTAQNVAYIGDDLNDLECMKLCGISACPNDAHKSVKEYADFICEHDGGHGAVRDFIDYLLNR
ncbi:MAG: HAD-IIIA family hydrolase [Clostridiales bacterium]|nr:HAD-IIIA family hydrolase [Clostridiales bacterium]